VAYRVTRVDGAVNGYIADLFTAPGDSVAARSLVGAALGDLARRGAGTALATAPPGTPLRRHLALAGFLPTGDGFGFQAVQLDPAVRVLGGRDWQLTSGDFDIDLFQFPPLEP
jgi:hypothetical protein